MKLFFMIFDYVILSWILRRSLDVWGLGCINLHKISWENFVDIENKIDLNYKKALKVEFC